jgi:AAA15 family ATPase/GTPase
MIIEFKIKNYRSIRDEISLNMEASGTKSKSEHVAEITTKAGKKYRLLKTAVIYGPNASGKSNIIRAFWAFKNLIGTSSRNDINDLIHLAEPFQLDPKTIDQPTEFYLKFIGDDMIQYIYKFSVHKTEGILDESLYYYPDKSQHLIFRRKGRKIIKLDDALVKQINIKNTVNPKRLLLSELANNGEVYWEKIRNFLIYGTTSLNTASNGMQSFLTNNAKRVFENQDNDSRMIKEKVINLLKLSDLGIKDVTLKEEEVPLRQNAEIIDNDDIYTSTQKQKRFKIHHTVFEDDKAKGTTEFDLINQGSAGSLALLGLSTEIMIALNSTYGKALLWTK